MGCDIYGVVERRVTGDERWIAYRTLDSISNIYGKKYGAFAEPVALSRNYERFAKLAGVRGDGPKARGMPADASETSLLRFKQRGGHTPSWLPLIEACDIFVATERGTVSDFDRNYSQYFYFGIEPEVDGPLSEFRLVFWFDS